MLLSIITPTLNAIRYLPDCIDSVQAQRATGGAAEHVIVDGGSTDGTVEYAEAQGLRVLRGTDRGIFDAINRGSRESCGSWVGFLGADDVMLPGGLQALIDAARITSAPWMTGGVRFVDAEFRSIGRLQPLPHWTPISLHACLGWSAIHHIATYISRDFFDTLGGFDIEYTVAADYELFCRAGAAVPDREAGRGDAAYRPQLQRPARGTRPPAVRGDPAALRPSLDRHAERVSTDHPSLGECGQPDVVRTQGPY